MSDRFVERDRGRDPDPPKTLAAPKLGGGGVIRRTEFLARRYRCATVAVHKPRLHSPTPGHGGHQSAAGLDLCVPMHSQNESPALVCGGAHPQALAGSNTQPTNNPNQGATQTDAVLALLCERFPKAFVRYEARRQPLKIGI